MGAVTEKAKDFAEGASQMAGQVQEKAQQLASQAYDRAEDAMDSFNSFVRRNPVPTVLIAAGVGFLLAACLFSAGSFSYNRGGYFR
jgi:ElaB/YqjD/DUF883 family membrane-anchored ribosome-binding protein